MFYVIPDTLLKVSLNTNKTGHHVHHVLRYMFYVKVVLNTNKTGHNVLRYTTLLKVSLNTNKTGHHVLRYTWHIVESVVKHQ